jgi:hypothetical protein
MIGIAHQTDEEIRQQIKVPDTIKMLSLDNNIVPGRGSFLQSLFSSLNRSTRLLTSNSGCSRQSPAHGKSVLPSTEHEPYRFIGANRHFIVLAL